MGSLIMIGIKPDLIDADAWKLTFADAMKNSIDTEDIACAQLVNLLVTKYKLFQYYWKWYLISYSTNR